MRLALISTVLLAAIASTANAQDPAAVVAAAVRATGSATVTSLVLTGSGSVGTLGQNVTPDAAWPLARVTKYTRQIDLTRSASSLESVRLQNGAETTQTQVVAPGVPWGRQVDLWVTTPYAFLRQASASGATLRTETVDGTRYTVLRITVDGHTVDGYLTDRNLVERIRTTTPNDVLGEMPVEGLFRDYTAFGVVQVPALTIVRQGGFPTLIAGVANATVNTPVSITPPPPPPPATPARVDAELVGKGLYYLKGGSHHSVLVEFADHVTLIEAPQDEARASALRTAIGRLYPKKPLTQVINTHHHFDHAGGLRTFAAGGTTIVTGDINKTFYEQAFPGVKLTAVTDTLVLQDATRTLELHALKTNAHDEGMLVAFLPAERILVEVDLYTPPAPGQGPAGGQGAGAPAADAPVNPNALALLTGLEKLRLDFDTILPLHGAAKATRADLYAFVKKPLVPVSELPDPDAPTRGPDGRLRGTALAPPANNNP